MLQANESGALSCRRSDSTLAESARPLRFHSLLDVGADHRVPILGDRLLGGALLLKRREHSRCIGLGWRELCEHLLRHLAVVGQVVEADGVAIALEPPELSL